METWLRSHAKPPEYRLSAADQRGLRKNKALHTALQGLREAEKKTYEAGLLHSEKQTFNANAELSGLRRSFPDAKLSNQDALTRALQAPASLAGLHLSRHSGLPGAAPPPMAPPAPAPGLAVNQIMQEVRDTISSAVDEMIAKHRKVASVKKSDWRAKQRQEYAKRMGSSSASSAAGGRGSLQTFFKEKSKK